MKIFIFTLLVVCFGCSGTKEYKIQFDNVAWLEKGTPVCIKGLKVGEVIELKLDEDKSALATIQIDGYIKITEGSKFTMQPKLIGAKSIEIELADNEILTDQGQIQIGDLKPMDTTE
jgi:ABC-type transporter Mla subunit MlaD